MLEGLLDGGNKVAGVVVAAVSAEAAEAAAAVAAAAAAACFSQYPCSIDGNK